MKGNTGMTEYRRREEKRGAYLDAGSTSANSNHSPVVPRFQMRSLPSSPPEARASPVHEVNISLNVFRGRDMTQACRVMRGTGRGGSLVTGVAGELDTPDGPVLALEARHLLPRMLDLARVLLASRHCALDARSTRKASTDA